MIDDSNLRRHIQQALEQLKDFQQATVDVVYQQLFREGRARMLVADEVGLGKTIVAKGVIARRLQEKLEQGDTTPFRVTYICSNQIIGQENLKKLDIHPQGQSRGRGVDRLAFLALKPRIETRGLLQLNTLTPGTSFRSSENAGLQDERKLLYTLLLGDALLEEIADGIAILLRGSVGRCAREWARDLRGARRSDLAGRLRDDITGKFLAYIQHPDVSVRSASVLNQLSLDHPVTLYDAVFECGYVLDYENYPGYRRTCLQLIRALRNALKSVCIDYLEADLYILDEFQRFRELIDESSVSEAAEVAKLIFGRPDTKVLLLSATPFKAFNNGSDTGNGDDHYREFRTVLSFLMENDPATLTRYETHRQLLFKQLLTPATEGAEIDPSHRVAVEKLLRQVMCRTERQSVSRQRDAMTVDRWHEGPVPLMTADVETFVATDGLVQALNSTTERTAYHLQPPVEFCKSAPYPLSFLEGYKLKRLLREKQDQPRVRTSLTESQKAWLNHERIDDYSLEVAEAGAAHSRFAFLAQEVLAGRAATLLWVPPSLPCYPLSGAYSQAEGYSKTLVFSSWLMVPRMVASLLSYEVERRTIGNQASQDPQERAPRTYFVPEGARRHPVPQLVYRVERDSDPSNMTNFALLYPSLTLAALFDSAEALVSGKERQSIEADLERRIRELAYDLDLEQFARKEGESDRWYWAAPLLLDRLSAEHSEDVEEWLHSEGIRETSFWRDKSAEVSGKKAHLYHLQRAFRAPWEIGLGPLPGDLFEVLAQLTLGSPAITVFRSLHALYPGQAPDHCLQALSAANEFLNLFNKPEAIAAVRLAVPEEPRYWRKVIRYCAEGCLQAVLDEYLHLLKPECATVRAAVTRLCDSATLKTSSINVDDLGAFLRNDRKRMRCHFAVDLGNQRIETEEGSNRVTSIRQNFNSPFRPFVLATTSIGQEGLDFHHYCRKVVHWNLPSNPIDLEQREGRVNRYKGHVIRLQVARK